MLGTFRFILAMLVVVQHLGGWPRVGGYAVQGFFILSGYLMTLVMAESYGYSWRGRRRFAINRFLRLYPSYYFILLLTLAAIVVIGEGAARELRSVMFLPRDWPSLFGNATMLFPSPFPASVEPRLSPPTWALTIELFWYGAIALGLAKDRLRASLWLLAGCLYMVVIALFFDNNHDLRYQSLGGGLLPFAIGATIYQFRDEFRRWLAGLPVGAGLALALGLFLVNGLTSAPVAAWTGSGPGAHGVFFYLNIVLCAVLVVLLTEGRLPASVPERLDRLLGDLSYPVYLSHYLAALVVVGLVPGLTAGPALFLLSLPLTLAVSAAAVVMIDRPVTAVRDTVRKGRKDPPDDISAPGPVAPGHP